MVDALQLSDIGLVLDFQKRDGWQHYPSPEHAAFKPDQQSKPAGYWAWGSIGVVGLAYNTNLVTAEQAPKNWKDALDPRWTDSITVKAATSGVQQFGRVIDGQDAIVHTAGYAPYLELKAKGAPLGFNFPPDGLPIDVGGIGIVAEPPHPQAARLFMDWLLGVPGQTALVEEAFAYSPRADVHPPAGAVPLESLKLLYPDDWEAFEKSHPQFVKDWNKITGIR